MNTKLALFSVLMTFASATLIGCAGEGVGSDNATEETRTESTQEALAVGIQTVNLYASALGLGAAQGQDSASPVATFKFAKGSIKYNTFTGTLTQVNVTAPRSLSLSKDVADLAVLLKFGTLTAYDAGGDARRGA